MERTAIMKKNQVLLIIAISFATSVIVYTVMGSFHSTPATNLVLPVPTLDSKNPDDNLMMSQAISDYVSNLRTFNSSSDELNKVKIRQLTVCSSLSVLKKIVNNVSESSLLGYSGPVKIELVAPVGLNKWAVTWKQYDNRYKVWISYIATIDATFNPERSRAESELLINPLGLTVNNIVIKKN